MAVFNVSLEKESSESKIGFDNNSFSLLFNCSLSMFKLKVFCSFADDVALRSFSLISFPSLSVLETLQPIKKTLKLLI